MARGQIEKLIPQLQSQDRVGLYSLESKVRIVQEITNDPSLLLQALKGVHAKLAPSQLSGHAEPPRAHEDTLPRLSDGTALRTQQSGDLTLGALEAIAQHLADVPGRKTLIWISRGLPLTFRTPVPQAINTKPRMGHPPLTDETDFTPQIQKTSRVLSNYGVAVYPVDARGLSALSGGAWNAEGTGLLLAKLTGGRPLYGDNDMGAAIRSAIDDSTLTYVLGFYPAPGKWDSKFHLIKVKVNQPGVKLLYRSGYLAAPEEQNPSPADSQSALGKAVLSPLDCTAIGLRAQLRKAHPFDIDLRVDVNNLMLSHNSDRWEGNLEIVIAQRTTAGSMVGGSGHKHSVKLNLNEDSYAQLKAQWLQVFFPVTLDRKAVQLKVVVRDTNSGAMGSVGIPLGKTAGE
jgi:VWFA-related protein